MATISLSYRASSALTVTNLQTHPTSATWITGWESSVYDNTSNLDLDAKVAGKIRVGSTVAAGQILVYIIAESKDAVWPDSLGTTDAAFTWTNAEIRDACAKLAAVINVVSTTANVTYHFECGSVAALFGGYMPRKFILWVSHSLGNNIHATGGDHVISVMGRTETVA